MQNRVILGLVLAVAFSNAEDAATNGSSSTGTSTPSGSPSPIANRLPSLPLPTASLLAPVRLICYYNEESKNRTDNLKFNISDVDSTLCSHVVYNGVTLDPNSLTIRNDSLGTDYESLKELRSKGLNVMLSLGGNADPLIKEKLSKMVNDGSARNHFVDSTVHLLRSLNLTGLDINWEYPSCPNGYCKGGRPGDKGNFVNLLKELYTAFKFHKLSLSVAVSPLDEIANKAYDVAGIARNVDWINLMTFDYKNGSYSKTAIHSPLGGSQPNTQSTVDYWKSRGAPPGKLVVGIPTFGRTYSLAKEERNGTDALAEIGRVGSLGTGIAAYSEVCTDLNYQHVEGVGSYGFKGDFWVSFDDPTSISKKGEYIKKNELGGGMIWSLDTDDFNGVCTQGKYPLVHALRQSLGI